MIFGMLPLSLGLTEGAKERASMGTVLIGGLISSLILTLALVPVVYTFVMGWVDKRERRAPTSTGRTFRQRPATSLSERRTPSMRAPLLWGISQ